MDTEHPIAESTPDHIFGHLSAEEFYCKHHVSHHEEFMINSRGMRIFTQKWEPLAPHGSCGVDGGIDYTAALILKGAVLVMHGFSVDSSWVLQLTAIAIAKRGFSVYAFDYEGHGRSDGRVRAHVPDFNGVADDCIQFSRLIKKQHKLLPLLVYAESLGAAVALLAHLQQPELYAGMVMQGAMCGISPKFLPPWPLTMLARAAAWLIPTWRVCWTPDNVMVSYKEAWKRRLVKSSPFKQAARPDAATGYAMLQLAAFLQPRLHLVSLPFLALHGEEDTVCELECVQALHRSACSAHKSIKAFPHMWHMFVGEDRQLTNLVLADILHWLDERVSSPNLC